jgi:lysophospholipase L1-like esterase
MEESPLNTRSRNGFYSLWTLAIILCLILSLFSVLLASCTKAESDSADSTKKAAAASQAATEAQDEDAAQDVIVTPEPTATPEPISTTLAETEDQGQLYLDRFVFLGDSTTYGLTYYDVLPNTQVWTPESGTLTLSNQSAAYVVYYQSDGSSENMTIADAVARRKPEYMVITLGVNGISFMSEEEFKSQYIDLIETIQANSPDTKIICQSIFPVIDSQAPDGIDNRTINVANTWVLTVAEETGTRYLNTCEVLKDESGSLRAEYCNGDGIHLSPEGGQAVVDYIRTHGYQ